MIRISSLRLIASLIQHVQTIIRPLRYVFYRLLFKIIFFKIFASRAMRCSGHCDRRLFPECSGPGFNAGHKSCLGSIRIVLMVLSNLQPRCKAKQGRAIFVRIFFFKIGLFCPLFGLILLIKRLTVKII